MTKEQLTAIDRRLETYRMTGAKDAQEGIARRVTEEDAPALRAEVERLTYALSVVSGSYEAGTFAHDLAHAAPDAKVVSA